MPKERIAAVLESNKIPQFGFVPFTGDLVLPSVRSVKNIPDGCKTVIVCLFPYFTGEDEERNVSRYAVSRDYHFIVKDLLVPAAEALAKEFPSYTFRAFCDASPIAEVRAAVRAGLGVLGKNRLFLSKRYGSYVFIGEILTDLPVDCEAKEETVCLSCGKCLSACPTGALTDTGVDITRCLSDITQRKGEFTKEEASLFDSGEFLWGCDICQQVCPYNADAEKTPLAAFYENRRPLVTKENVLEDFDERAYAWRGKSVILRNIERKAKE